MVTYLACKKSCAENSRQFTSSSISISSYSSSSNDIADYTGLREPLIYRTFSRQGAM